MHCGQERCCAFSVSGSNSAPFFQIPKGIFHQLPQFVEVPVIRALLFAVLARRNLRQHVLPRGLRDDRVAVVSLVGDQMLGRQTSSSKWAVLFLMRPYR